MVGKKLGNTLLLFIVFVVPLASLTSGVAFSQTASPNEPIFNNFQFNNTWIAQDRQVGTPGVERFYTWGPAVGGGAENIKSENYVESPNGQRPVQYFDKARMEINQPFSGGNVTTGLLVRDLVTGQRQDGDNTFASLPPSQTQVAGDDVSVNGNAPVYASFRNYITFGTPDNNSKPSANGVVVNQIINKAGQISNFSPPQQLAIGAYQPETGHNIAGVFQEFMNIRGPVINPQTNTRLENQPVYTNNPTVNVFGYAVTEPYWVNTRVAGQDRTVLVQLFQRRVLTYNPALPGQKVEMGNLGQHYYKWRYVENAGTAFPPFAIQPAECLPGSTTTGVDVQACLSDTTPAKGSNVTLYARLIIAGKAVSGATFQARFGFFNRVVECTSGSSNASGVASCSVNVGNDNSPTNVDVQVVFDYNGRSYRNSLEFRPS